MLSMISHAHWLCLLPIHCGEAEGKISHLCSKLSSKTMKGKMEIGSELALQ